MRQLPYVEPSQLHPSASAHLARWTFRLHCASSREDLLVGLWVTRPQGYGQVSQGRLVHLQSEVRGRRHRISSDGTQSGLTPGLVLQHGCEARQDLRNEDTSMVKKRKLHEATWMRPRSRSRRKSMGGCNDGLEAAHMYILTPCYDKAKRTYALDGPNCEAV